MSSKRTRLHLILLLLAYYCSTQIAANSSNYITVGCLLDQASSLLQLKRSFHNPNLSSWQHGTDCCHWEGVDCNTASGRVIMLDLSYRNLLSTGGLSPALFNLTSLTNLSLSGTDFSHASLPNFGFEQLSNLISLDLADTSLAGQIPSGISHLKNLRTLDLYDNDFEGEFPTKIFHLKKLRFIDLSCNTRLSGHLPIFPVVNSLEFLDVVETNFTIRISTLFVNLRFLSFLGLSLVEATEDSISLISKLPSLRWLLLYGSGSKKHNFSRIANLERLVGLTLLDYNFSSSMPSWIANLTSLTNLNLEGCSLYGRIPTWIGNLTVIIEMHNNKER